MERASGKLLLISDVFDVVLAHSLLVVAIARSEIQSYCHVLSIPVSELYLQVVKEIRQ